MPTQTRPVATDQGLVAVHVNIPSDLWHAVGIMSRVLHITKTNIIVRALNKEMFFNRVKSEDPDAQVYVRHSDGTEERVTFV